MKITRAILRVAATGISLAVGLALVPACGPSLTDKGVRVKVAPDADAVASCQPISAVEAVAGSPHDVEILMRNKAATMDGNMVYVEDKSENDGRHMYTGKAYDCKRELVP